MSGLLKNFSGSIVFKKGMRSHTSEQPDDPDYIDGEISAEVDLTELSGLLGDGDDISEALDAGANLSGVGDVKWNWRLQVRNGKLLVIAQADES